MRAARARDSNGFSRTSAATLCSRRMEDRGTPAGSDRRKRGLPHECARPPRLHLRGHLCILQTTESRWVTTMSRDSESSLERGHVPLAPPLPAVGPLPAILPAIPGQVPGGFQLGAHRTGNQPGRAGQRAFLHRPVQRSLPRRDGFPRPRQRRTRARAGDQECAGAVGSVGERVSRGSRGAAVVTQRPRSRGARIAAQTLRQRIGAHL